MDNSQDRSGSFGGGHKSSSKSYNDRRLSNISAHSGLRVDFFDPPLLDYQQLFESKEVPQDQIFDRDNSIPIFEASPDFPKKERKSMNLNPSEY